MPVLAGCVRFCCFTDCDFRCTSAVTGRFSRHQDYKEARDANMGFCYRKNERSEHLMASGQSRSLVALAGLALTASVAHADGDPCPRGQPGHLSAAQVQKATLAIDTAKALKKRGTRQAQDKALAELLRVEVQLGGCYSEELSDVRGLLAGIYKNRDEPGHLAKARTYAQQALDIARCLKLGDDVIVDDLRFQADIEDAAEEPQSALSYANQALVPCTRERAMQDGDLALSCVEARNTLAVILQRQSRFDEAEVAYRQVIKEAKDWQLKQAPDYRRNWATFLHEIGAYEDAVRELEAAKLEGAAEDLTDIENRAAAYDALAIKQRQIPGQEEAADSTDKKAMAAFDEANAKYMSSTEPGEKRAYFLSNYAYHLREHRRYQEAERACREGQALINPRVERTVGAMLHYQLSRIFADQQRNQDALDEHQRALDQLRSRNGRNLADWTPTTLLFEVLVKGADLHEKLGQTAEAETELDVALQISETHLDRVRSVVASGRLQQFADVLMQSQELIYQFAYKHRTDSGIVALGLRTVLLRKDRVQEEAVEQSHLFSRLSQDERVQLARIHRDMSNLAPRNDSSVQGNKELLDAQRRYNNQADALVSRVRGLRIRHLPQPEAIEAAVRHQLGSDAALIEIASFGSLRNTDGRRYIAFVICPGKATQLVDLGLQSDLNKTLAGLRNDLLTGGLWRRGPVPAGARSLYKLLLEGGGISPRALRKVYFAAQGVTYGLPLASLHDGTHYLLEQVSVIHLTSGRDLLRGLPPIPDDKRPLDVVAFVDPDLDAVLPGPAGDKRLIEEIGKEKFDPLSFARAEGTFLREAILARAIYSREQALLERLLQVERPGILHLAMHSWLLPLMPRLGLPELDRALVMAGARRTPAQGLLTGPQISTLNLWGTEVAFLSSCQLVGRDVSGSLWRAFLTAGAETVVTTLALRNLDDAAAEGMMLDYYDGLSRGQERHEALRQALLTAYHRYGQPYYLSAFATFGADGPLRRPLRIVPGAVAKMRWSHRIKIFGPWVLIGGGALALALVIVLGVLQIARARRPI